MSKEEIKRLFFGVEVHAPWPQKLPKGRTLEESHRHLTLAFLGNIPYQPLLLLLNQFPKFPTSIGTAGYFDSCLFLPSHHLHVAAWHASWFDDSVSLSSFQKELSQWLHTHSYQIDNRPWMPHLTLCREPFDKKEWKEAFSPLPFYTGDIHLYESQGQLTYIPIWTFPIKAPFEEIEHTADMAFIIRADTLEQIYQHAFTALAFKAPELLQFYASKGPFKHLDEIIIALNGIITHADCSVGCPMKAVSFHGEIIKLADSTLQWEMIVDV